MRNILGEVIDKSRIEENVSMAERTTFRTGGKADIFVTPSNAEELKNVIKCLYENGCPYYVLGNGSNILVSDRGLRRPVIHIGKTASEIGIFEDCIRVSAGATLSSAARAAMQNSLAGMEFASGIPGTVGGALIMNAGAYGGEMKQITEAVSYIDPSGEEHIASNDEMEFSYRRSALSDTGCIITGAVLKLRRGEQAEINEKMQELARLRREKQPLEFPSAGSTFKRPEGYFAGTLIEQTGLKGYTIGGAQVSEKHAGFIINRGGATTEDILALINYVRCAVLEKHGVELEPEVKYWSDDE